VRVRCQASVPVHAVKHLHKQCVRRKDLEATLTDHEQVARKTPPILRSLSQDATAKRTSNINGHSSIGSSFDSPGMGQAPLWRGACSAVCPSVRDNS
jgi:hypothetical protein